MKSGRLLITRGKKFGFGLPWSVKPGALSAWLLVSVLPKLVRHCGSHCRLTTANALFVTPTSGPPTKPSCPPNAIVELANRLGKPPLSNDLTTPCLNAVPIWFVKRCHSVRISSFTSFAFNASLFITIVVLSALAFSHQFNLDHYPRSAL